MSKTFTEIKSSLASNIFFADQFKDFVSKVTASELYVYKNDETSDRSKGYKGYEKWAEPVACLSRMNSQNISQKRFKELIEEANLSTKDLYDLYLCFMACHRWILLSTEKKSSAKDRVLALRELLLDCLKEKSDYSSVSLDSLNSKNIKDIVLYMSNMEIKSDLPFDKKSPHSDFMFWKMADLLLKEEFQLIEKTLNKSSITDYIHHILAVKESLTAEQNAYGIKDFTPLYILRDQNYETYGKLLVENKDLMDQFIREWIVSATKENRDKGGEGMFQDGGYSFLGEEERYYAYTHLVKLSLEHKNYDALGQLLLLKSTAYIPSTLKEIPVSEEILDIIPWNDSMEKLSGAFSKSNRAFHLNFPEFEGLTKSQIFPYFLRISLREKDDDIHNSSSLKFKTFACVNLSFERLSGYCLWFLDRYNSTPDSNPIKEVLETKFHSLKEFLRQSLNNREKSSFIRQLKGDYQKSTLTKGKECSVLSEILFTSMTDNEIAAETLQNIKEFVFSTDQKVPAPFMTKETWETLNTRFLSKKPNSVDTSSLKKKKRKILTA